MNINTEIAVRFTQKRFHLNAL